MGFILWRRVAFCYFFQWHSANMAAPREGLVAEGGWGEDIFFWSPKIYIFKFKNS